MIYGNRCTKCVLLSLVQCFIVLSCHQEVDLHLVSKHSSRTLNIHPFAFCEDEILATYLGLYIDADFDLAVNNGRAIVSPNNGTFHSLKSGTTKWVRFAARFWRS